MSWSSVGLKRVLSLLTGYLEKEITLIRVTDPPLEVSQQPEILTEHSIAKKFAQCFGFSWD